MGKHLSTGCKIAVATKSQFRLTVTSGDLSSMHNVSFVHFYISKNSSNKFCNTQVISLREKQQHFFKLGRR
jgi:hypothetical protein